MSVGPIFPVFPDRQQQNWSRGTKQQSGQTPEKGEPHQGAGQTSPPAAPDTDTGLDTVA